MDYGIFDRLLNRKIEGETNLASQEEVNELAETVNEVSESIPDASDIVDAVNDYIAEYDSDVGGLVTMVDTTYNVSNLGYDYHSGCVWGIGDGDDEPQFLEPVSRIYIHNLVIDCEDGDGLQVTINLKLINSYQDEYSGNITISMLNSLILSSLKAVYSLSYNVVGSTHNGSDTLSIFSVQGGSLNTDVIKAINSAQGGTSVYVSEDTVDAYDDFTIFGN